MRLRLLKSTLVIQSIIIFSFPSQAQELNKITFQKVRDSTKHFHLSIGNYKRADEIFLIEGDIISGILHHIEDSFLVLFIHDTTRNDSVSKLLHILYRGLKTDLIEYNRVYFGKEQKIHLSQIKEIRIKHNKDGYRRVLTKILDRTFLPVATIVSIVTINSLVLFAILPAASVAAIYGTWYLISYKKLKMKEWKIL